MRRALFLDRDGVITEERGTIVDPASIVILPGVGSAIARAVAAGYLPVVVTNQTGVARGAMTLETLEACHERMNEQLVAAGGVAVDHIFVCLHHPHAQVERYRLACPCRKPRPGLVLRAAEELGLDIGCSALVGDRPSDIACGFRAGVRHLVRVGPGDRPPIVGSEALSDRESSPSFVAPRLTEAVAWLLARDR